METMEPLPWKPPVPDVVSEEVFESKSSSGTTPEMTNLSLAASSAVPALRYGSSSGKPTRKHTAPEKPPEGLPIGQDVYYLRVGEREVLRTADLYACLDLAKTHGLHTKVYRASDGALLAYKSALSLEASIKEP